MYFKSLILLVITGLCFITNGAYPSENPGSDKESFITLYLTGKVQSDETLPTNVTTVSEKEIKKVNARNIAETLDYSNNLNIGKYGSLGSMSSLILRGALSKQVLLLVDGRPVNDTTLGGFNYSELSVENIDRVEIIRGAASSIYGANALAGVINVITKETCFEKPIVIVNTSFGELGERTLGLNISKKYGNVESNISGSKILADGFRENTSYNNNNLDVYIGFNSETAGKFKLKSGIAQYDLGVAGKNITPIEQWDNNKEKMAYDPLAKQKSNKNYLNLSYEKDLTEKVTLFSRLYGSMELGRYTSPISFIDDSTGKETVGLDMRCSIPYGLTAGCELRKDSAKRINELFQATSFDEKIDWTSLYFQEEYSPVSSLNTILGLRYDKHSLFGGETSPQLTVVWEPVLSWKLSSNIGKSYRTPSFEDLFSPYSSWPAWGIFPGGDTQGNLDVKPETSLSYDMGIERQWKDLITSKVTIFRQDIDNLIEWSNISNDPMYERWRPSNVSQAYNQGIEFELKHSINNDLSYDLNYAYLESKGKRKMEQDCKTLMYRPMNTINCILTYMLPWESNIAFTGKYVGEQYDELNNVIPAYSLFNIRLNKLFFNYTKIFIAIDDVADTRYSTRTGYPLPGRLVRGGISITF